MELTLKNLTKRYGSFTAVSGLNYTMQNGVYGLLGVNGAGKTTLMRMICTLMKPTQGCITCDGRDIFEMGGEYRCLIGYLPQEFGYYPDLNVLDYLLYIAAIKGIRPSVAKNRINILLEQVGLNKELKKKMRKLSGGMIRRVGIAQAMLNDPKILILDEPTAGLDPKERIRFRNLISDLSENRLVMLSTHIVSDVEFIANKIIMMNRGRFFFSGKSNEMISSIKDKVWTASIPNDRLDTYLSEYLVANIKRTSQGAEVRILSEKEPIKNSVRSSPTLEDAFLYYFGEKAGIDE